MAPRPICFTIMPFGTKPTQQAQGSSAPAKVNFDKLWDSAISKAIDAAGYDPVRADQDIGASIITEMIERLAISDLVVAEMSIPNGNVYYEVGVRHAAREFGCVLIAADWAQPLFDVNQMRQIRYPLPAETVDDATAAEIRRCLEAIPKLAAGNSPVWSALPGYPSEIQVDRSTAFRSMLRELSDFQAAVAGVRAGPAGECAKSAEALVDRYYPPDGPVQTIVALDLLYLLRDCAGWQPTLDFIAKLRPPVSEMPVVREQRALALSKTGKHGEAIGILLELVKQSDTSERRGLLGGRYKALANQSTDAAEAASYRNRAIEQYERGMRLDLNDYYPASNLPLLYHARNEPGDKERAVVAAAVTLVGCERARARNSEDEWLNPTLLVAAFVAGDVSKARELTAQIQREGAISWKLGTAIADLEVAVSFHTGPERAELDALLTTLRGVR